MGNSKASGNITARRLPELAGLYDALFAIEVTILAVVIYRFLCIFRINNYFNILYLTVMDCFGLFLPYVVVLVTILCSCAVFTQSLWGTFNDRYRSFGRAFLSNTLALIGGPDINFWLFQASDWSVVYFLVFFIWITLLLPSVCIGIFMESYRIMNLKMGYPDTKKEESWGFKDYLKWLFQCCPMCLKNKMGLADEDRNRVNDSDND
jgi:membrane-bound metal-dependent hydrolase YbcI (DUF457 family)